MQHESRLQLRSMIKPILKILMVFLLVVTVTLGQADGALAARSGGRMGGGSFRMPSRSYAPPTRTYQPAPGGYYGRGYGYGGGGFGFPFLLPLFGFGGGFGGLFTILIFVAIANFLVQNFRRIASGEDEGSVTATPQISVARVQVGLMAQARELQRDLNRLAAKADTGTSEGLANVLRETSLALMRHPDYWMYGAAESQQTSLSAAEAQFNRLSLAERSKFSHESLSNFNSQLSQSNGSSLTVSQPAGALSEAPGEYIVVTLLVGTQGKVQLPKVNSSTDLKQVLGQVGAIAADQLLAVEVLWSPQAEGEALSADDMIVEYPDLKLL